jgi:hypothetical protein
VSANGAPRTRPYTWRSSATAISTPESLTTDDPLMTVRVVPTPILNLMFGGRADGTITLASALAPRQTPDAPSLASLHMAEGAPYCPVGTDADALAHPHRIELSIDSLPNHFLIEPIPVAIDPVGDAAYTAWVRKLDTNATGQSVFEALLLLKERIEFLYDDLNQQTHLTNEQKMTLQMLHTYIAPKKPEWA